MKHLFLLSLLSINPLDIFSVDSDYGAQRCRSQECTCRVNMSKVSLSEIEIKTTSSELVYFLESSSDLSYDEKKSIIDYLDRVPNQNYFTVTGYTDGCGSSGYNYSLSLRRASSVRNVIVKHRSGARVVVRGASEASGQHSPGQRKVIIHSQATHKGFPSHPEIIADVYLIDASGSMTSSFKSWVEAIEKSRPRGSKVYISYSNYCYNGQNVMSVNPGGSTEIWYSYWSLIDKMSPGQTLAIISDFDSNVPLTSREREMINAKVKSKGIKVIAFMP